MIDITAKLACFSIQSDVRDMVMISLQSTSNRKVYNHIVEKKQTGRFLQLLCTH
jgi:hypothetical protein